MKNPENSSRESLVSALQESYNLSKRQQKKIKKDIEGGKKASDIYAEMESKKGTTNELIGRNFKQSISRISQGIVGVANLVDGIVLTSGKVAATAVAIPESFVQALNSQEKNLMDYRRDHIEFIDNNPNIMRAFGIAGIAFVSQAWQISQHLGNLVR
jgi:hypothetical protein